jgi:hypothetical protein
MNNSNKNNKLTFLIGPRSPEKELKNKTINKNAEFRPHYSWPRFP